MAKIKSFFQKIWPSKRKWMQLYFALLFNANLKGFVNVDGLFNGKIYEGNTKKMCVPGINCYSCPGAVGACPLGSLQGAIGEKNTLFYVGGTLMLYAILFGRMICGWLCPFGWIQELLHKIKTPKVKKNRITKVLSYFKYVVLAFFVIIVPTMYAFRNVPLPAFCKYICPAGTLEGGIGLLSNKVNDSYFSMLGPLFTWKFLLMVSILVGCIFVFRLFCRFLCPLGALYALFNRFSIFGIKLNRDKCVDCNRCIAHCEMDIRHVGDPECISCGECIAVCPTEAIQWKGPKILLPKNVVSKDDTPEVAKAKNKKKLVTRIVSTVVLLAILVGTGVYHWNKAAVPMPKPPAQQDVNPEVDAPLGNAVGNLCYGADLKVIVGTDAATINPVKTGKVTIINFWGTWCTGCIAELPYFNEIAVNYQENVTVVAVHCLPDGNKPAREFADREYPGSPIVFAFDYGATLNDYYTLLGGRGAYPYTVIVDERGVITHTFFDPLTYDKLENAILPLLK
ncbi:MAG: 4Fe-4S binding protein [Clostridia bacterium]|nr:4Fe-4S binding protein [Clostridia bacterium]